MNTANSAPQNMNLVYTAPPDKFPPPLGFKADAVKIYVGDGFSAVNVPQLNAYELWGVLNVAYDLDDQPQGDAYSHPLLEDPHRPAPSELGQVQELSRYQQQFAKVGLIDGYGNIPNEMSVLAAVYMAEQLFTFDPDAPDVCPPLVNRYQRGNLLIHCWSGKSRSVTVAALYIWYKFGVQLNDTSLTSFADVYNMVKTKRGDTTEPIQAGHICTPVDTDGMTEPPPTCGMQTAALHIVDKYATLFPELTLK